MTVILVALTILFFLGLDWLVHSHRERSEAPASKPAPGMAPGRVRVPAGLFFAPSHTWLNLFPTGRVTLGVDDFVSRLIDSPRISLLKRAGEPVAKGEPILTLESDTRSLTVRSPIDGEIVTSNANLVAAPRLLREALFSDGWAYAVKPRSVRDVKSLLLGDESRDWIRGEFARLRDFFATTGPEPELSPALLQDGGAPVTGALAAMDAAEWQRFETEFLAVK